MSWACRLTGQGALAPVIDCIPSLLPRRHGDDPEVQQLPDYPLHHHV